MIKVKSPSKNNLLIPPLLYLFAWVLTNAVFFLANSFMPGFGGLGLTFSTNIFAWMIKVFGLVILISYLPAKKFGDFCLSIILVVVVCYAVITVDRLLVPFKLKLALGSVVEAVEGMERKDTAAKSKKNISGVQYNYSSGTLYSCFEYHDLIYWMIEDFEKRCKKDCRFIRNTNCSDQGAVIDCKRQKSLSQDNPAEVRRVYYTQIGPYAPAGYKSEQCDIKQGAGLPGSALHPLTAHSDPFDLTIERAAKDPTYYSREGVCTFVGSQKNGRYGGAESTTTMKECANSFMTWAEAFACGQRADPNDPTSEGMGAQANFGPSANHKLEPGKEFWVVAKAICRK
ncbi:MAG TPA: hypothetical protein VN132_13550 [Bdellovibrio sp.]|nr:hypothetical protein [Bdellovibrio sp.]